MLKNHNKQGKWIAAICAAPTVLAKHGLLEGKRVTSYPSFQSALGGAQVIDANVVEDGTLITSQGPATAISFSLKLIEKFVGLEKAKEIEKKILADK